MKPDDLEPHEHDVHRAFAGLRAAMHGSTDRFRAALEEALDGIDSQPGTVRLSAVVLGAFVQFLNLLSAPLPELDDHDDHDGEP